MKQVGLRDDVYRELELVVKENCILENPTVNQLSVILSGAIEEACRKYLNEYYVKHHKDEFISK